MITASAMKGLSGSKEKVHPRVVSYELSNLNFYSISLRFTLIIDAFVYMVELL